MDHSPISLWPDPDALGPVTDLYQLTMMAGYRAEGMADLPATFELFVRRLPEHRAYLVFAGLEQAVGDILRLAFSSEQAEWLNRHPAFSHVDAAFFEWLVGLRFRGDLWSVPEGTIVFPNETIVRIEAPLAQAQWIETYLIASLNYATLVASKATRIVEAARGTPCLEFGLRRGHGPYAGMVAARSAYLAGFEGTSNVEAARLLDIPAVGTMAHSWVQAFPSERDAFRAFARTFPETTTLLVDTYGTLEGVAHAAEIDPPVQGIRLDSGNLGELATEARAILDERGRREVKILASSDLDEERIDELVTAGVPIDGFAVGTELITSRDAPALSMVYKLVALNGQGRIKMSPGKKTHPLGKQVWRVLDASRWFDHDHVTRWDESAEGEPLLRPIVRGGQLVESLPDLNAIRHRVRDQINALPDRLRGVHAQAGYHITYSDILENEAARLGVRS